MLERFIIYGVLGWCLEIIFTGVSSLVFARDRSATAKTYLWMHPIYGGTALVMELASAELAPAPYWVRLLTYLAIIYAAELASGHLLRKLLGRCPWDYAGHGIHVRGLIRLDYAPLWLLVGALVEPAQGLTRAVVEQLWI